MFEHPIKRAGLTYNRILFGNTKMVHQAFTGGQAHRFGITFQLRTYDNGKIVERQSKFVDIYRQDSATKRT